MKIAIYYPWLYLTSGVERTILEIVKRSKHQYTIFTNHYDRKNTYTEFAKSKVVELKKVPVRRDVFSVSKAAVTILSQKINLGGYDLLVVSSEGLGDLVLFRNNGIPAICFCHTPLRPVFDPEYKKRASNAVLALLFKYLDRYLWKKYKYIFFNSRESFNRAKKGGLMNRGVKYQVLHPGVDWQKIKPKEKFEKYFFVPGRIMWTKNIELAIGAFKLFSNNHADFRLVIAGMVDKKSLVYYRKLRRLAQKNTNIKFIINISDKKMKELYADCYAVLATSFNEDWGLTPIEANAYGKPVLAVNKGGFKESQIDGKTGFLLPDSPEAFCAKMELLAKDRKLVKTMGDYARDYSKRFDWSLFVKTLDKKLEDLYA